MLTVIPRGKTNEAIWSCTPNSSTVVFLFNGSVAADEDVPQGLVDLDDEDTPKSNISVNNEKNNSTPIYAGIAISLAAIVGIIVAFMTIRKKRV